MENKNDKTVENYFLLIYNLYTTYKNTSIHISINV